MAEKGAAAPSFDELAPALPRIAEAIEASASQAGVPASTMQSTFWNQALNP